MTETDTKAPAPRQAQTQAPEQKTGPDLAQERQEAATRYHEMAAEALKPTAEDDSGPKAKPLDPNPPFDVTEQILSDYWDATDDAAGDDDSGGNNQAGPRFQPPTGTLQDPDNPDDPEARIDPAQASQDAQDESSQDQAASTDSQAAQDAPQAQQQPTSQDKPAQTDEPKTQPATPLPEQSQQKPADAPSSH
jgi:hypothetical protein